MKKLFVCIIAVAIMLSTLPMPAFCTEKHSTEQIELINIACDVFPEYSEKIKNQEIRVTYGRSVEENTLVASDIRAISENEYLMYSEYSNGVILLTDYEFGYSTTTNEYDSNTMTTTVNLDIKATCTNVTGYFLLSGVEYMLINGSYDIITEVGTPTYSGKCSLHTAYTPKLEENAAGNASIDYRLAFQFGPGGYYTFNSLLTLSVGKDTATITHVNNS